MSQAIGAARLFWIFIPRSSINILALNPEVVLGFI